MKNWKNWLIVVLVIVVVVGGTYFFITKKNSKKTLASAPQFMFEKIEKGTLTSKIGTTGKIRSAQTIKINWLTSGSVETVLVHEGDQVKKEDILGSLKMNSLPENVILAAEDYKNALENLEKVKENTSSLKLAEAEKAVNQAQEDLKDAERQLGYLSNPHSKIYIDEAHTKMMIAEKKLNESKREWDEWSHKNETNPDRAYVQQAYIAALQEYNRTVANYNYISTPAKQSDIEMATNKVVIAKETLLKAERHLEKIKTGATEEEIAAAEAKVLLAEKNMDVQFLKAPFSGTITIVKSKMNDMVDASTLAFRLDDTSQYLIDLLVSEIDINKIQVGQKAFIMLDSTKGVEYAGEVISKGLIGQEDAVVNFPVTVKISNPDEIIKIGMTTTVDILMEQGEEALLVPNTAIVLEKGKYFIFVKDESQENQDTGIGTPPVKKIEVIIGMSSKSHSTIIGGELIQKDKILVNPTAMNPQNTKVDLLGIEESSPEDFEIDESFDMGY